MYIINSNCNCKNPPSNKKKHTHTQSVQTLNTHSHTVQTWDLFRLMKCGFIGLCTDFTSRHGPDNYIVPVRVNGSAIESLFSRFKYNANGNLSAVNYESAMSRLLTANSIDQGFDYRRSELNVMTELKRT